jgi:hypothetical protein
MANYVNAECSPPALICGELCFGHRLGDDLFMRVPSIGPSHASFRFVRLTLTRRYCWHTISDAFVVLLTIA